jgi:hypothetical protein
VLKWNGLSPLSMSAETPKGGVLLRSAAVGCAKYAMTIRFQLLALQHGERYLDPGRKRPNHRQLLHEVG